MQNTMRRHLELGPIYQRIILGQPIVFVTGQALVVEINNGPAWEKHMGKPVEALRAVAGDGLFTAYNDEPNWEKAHNILEPAFTQAAMRSYHDIMLDTARDLVTSLATKADYFDVTDERSKLTLETIGRTGFQKADLEYQNSVVREEIENRRVNGNSSPTDLLDRMLAAVDEESGRVSTS